jgi:hypothetical protein
VTEWGLSFDRRALGNPVERREYTQAVSVRSTDGPVLDKPSQLGDFAVTIHEILLFSSQASFALSR